MTFDAFALHMAEFPEPEASARKVAAAQAQDAAWVAGIRAGDQRTFDAMFEAHYERLCAFAATVVGSDAVAEEVVQETFLKIWEQRERWHVTTTVAAYLYRAVRNRAIGQVRHGLVERRLQDRVGIDHPVPALGERPATPEEELRATELTSAIEGALAALPPRCREAFLLRRRHGLSYSEIADTMGITQKTVEVQIGAALRSLRAALRDWL